MRYLQLNLLKFNESMRYLGVTFDRDFNFRKYVSLRCRSWFYHIRDLRRNRGYITRRLQCVHNCLARVLTRSPRFSHSVPLLKSLHCSISHHIQTLHHCLSISFFWRTFISIFYASFTTQAQRTPFIWLSLIVCSQC